MKKKIIIILLIGLVLLIIGTGVNVWSYFNPEGEEEFNEEKFTNLTMESKHCYEGICITDLYIESIDSPSYGQEYDLGFDIINNNKDNYKDVKLSFTFKTDRGKFEVKAKEGFDLEKGIILSTTLNGFTENYDELSHVIDYEFTYEHK